MIEKRDLVFFLIHGGTRGFFCERFLLRRKGIFLYWNWFEDSDDILKDHKRSCGFKWKENF